jgi:hypothetical protein
MEHLYLLLGPVARSAALGLFGWLTIATGILCGLRGTLGLLVAIFKVRHPELFDENGRLLPDDEDRP